MICTRTGGMGLNHMIRTRAKLYSVMSIIRNCKKVGVLFTSGRFHAYSDVGGNDSDVRSRYSDRWQR